MTLPRRSTGTMILDVPFAYDVLGTEPGKRSSVVDRRRGVVGVWVEDVSPEAAPIAVVWRRGPDHDGRPQTDLSIRQHDGALWVTAAGSHDTPGSDSDRPLAGDALAAAVREGRRGGNPFARFLTRIPDEGSPEIHFRREIRNEREGIEAEVRSRAAEAVAIDGELHLRCPEPVFKLSVARDRQASRSVEACWYEPWRHASARSGGIYRVDEWDRLLDDAGAAFKGGREAMDLPAEQSQFEVRIPDAFTLPTEGAALASAAFHVLDGLAREISDRVETSRVGRNMASKEDGGRSPLDWTRPFEVELPEPAVVEAWTKLAALMKAGLDETSAGILREVASVGVADASWRTESLKASLAALGSALDRWDARPMRFRAAGVEALAGLGPSP